MRSDLEAILRLEVPLIVLLGKRKMRVGDVMALIPGAIIELPKGADDELEVYVNNRPVGAGHAVKVGENFGVRITYTGDLRERIRALGATTRDGADTGERSEETDVEALAEQMLAGQV